jgi:hypothetical protein
MVSQLEGEVINVEGDCSVLDILLLSFWFILLFVIVCKTCGRACALAMVRKCGNARRQALGHGTGEQLQTTGSED